MLTDRSAVEKAIAASDISDKAGALEVFKTSSAGKSNTVARDIAADILGKPVFFDWDGELLSSLYHLYSQLADVTLLAQPLALAKATTTSVVASSLPSAAPYSSRRTPT